MFNDPPNKHGVLHYPYKGSVQNPNMYKPYAFFAASSHYSILKLLIVLDIPCVVIGEDKEGRINVS